MVPEGTKLKMTPEVMKKLEEAFAMDCSNAEAARYANISHQTLLNWLRSDEEFRERLEELRAEPMLKARSTIVRSLSNPEHAKWYVERKNKKEFAQRTELTGSDGKDLPTPILKLDVQRNDRNSSSDRDDEAHPNPSGGDVSQ